MDNQNWAIRFHEAYERLAPEFGYATRKVTRIWDPDSPNARLMIAVMEELGVTQLEAQIERQAETIKDCHSRIATLSVKLADGRWTMTSFERLKIAIDELFAVFAQEVGMFQIMEWIMSKLDALKEGG